MSHASIGVHGSGPVRTNLPNQNGAPIRLVTPWKYGFKGIKSIVELILSRTNRPRLGNISRRTNMAFHSNVNPKVARAGVRLANDTLVRAQVYFNARHPP